MRQLLEANVVPKSAVEDAFHLAFSAVNGVDVLLTWNCKHIANINVMRGIDRICQKLNYETPLIATPLELLGRES